MKRHYGRVSPSGIDERENNARWCGVDKNEVSGVRQRVRASAVGLQKESEGFQIPWPFLLHRVFLAVHNRKARGRPEAQSGAEASGVSEDVPRQRHIGRKPFGQLLRQARKKMRISQTELAIIFNVQRTTISNWEQGISEPTLLVGLKLLEFLGIELNQIKRDEVAN